MLAALALASQAVAATGVQTWTGGSATTPDIERTGLTLYDDGGAVITTNGSAGTINFTLDGTPYVGYCTDVQTIFNLGSAPVDFISEDPPSSHEGRAAAWIVANRTPTGASTAEKAQTASVSQVAVWLLTDADVNPAGPTGDPALNAAAQALVQEALAATVTPASLGLQAAAPAAGALSTTVAVTGRPGAVVDLSATSGTLSAGQVTLDGNGNGAVTLTVAAPGPVTVSATTAGDPTLIRIDPQIQEDQSTVAAGPTTLTAQASVVFQAAPTTPTTPTGGTTGGPTPAMAILKTGPKRARVLQRVRYRITIRNTSTAVVRNIVLRDRLPGGLALVRSSRRGVMRSGSLRIRIGNLAPGRSRTVYVWVRANANVRGARVNTATAVSSNARPVRARARTVFQARPRRIQPAVTG